MNDWFVVLLALIEGVVIGVIYFGGRWLTTQHPVRTKETDLVKTVSLSVRLGVVLFGFYLIILMSGLPGFLSCTTGFLGIWLTLSRWVPDARLL